MTIFNYQDVASSQSLHTSRQSTRRLTTSVSIRRCNLCLSDFCGRLVRSALHSDGMELLLTAQISVDSLSSLSSRRFSRLHFSTHLSCATRLESPTLFHTRL